MALSHPWDIRPENRRRSKRIRARVAVAARPLTSDGQIGPEKTHTITVNAHGGLILLQTQVAVDQLLLLENLETKKEIICRVTLLGPSFMGKTQVAVEFIMPAPGFWAIPDPPKDWKADEN
jgi:hypothetical protein